MAGQVAIWRNTSRIGAACGAENSRFGKRQGALLRVRHAVRRLSGWRARSGRRSIEVGLSSACACRFWSGARRNAYF